MFAWANHQRRLVDFDGVFDCTCSPYGTRGRNRLRPSLDHLPRARLAATLGGTDPSPRPERLRPFVASCIGLGYSPIMPRAGGDHVFIDRGKNMVQFVQWLHDQWFVIPVTRKE